MTLSGIELVNFSEIVNLILHLMAGRSCVGIIQVKQDLMETKDHKTARHRNAKEKRSIFWIPI